MAERKPVTFALPAKPFVTTCRSCGARVVWVVTAAGKKMPVDYTDGATEGVSHFATCAQAEMWRGPR